MDKFNNLNQEEKRNIIIALVAIVLIVGGIVYANVKNKNTSGINAPVVEEVDENTNTDTNTEVEDGVEVDEGAPSVEAGKPAVVSDPNKPKFDLALKNGQDAFLAGNYAQAIVYYNQALTYKNSDVVYVRLHTTYNIQGNTVEAIKAIDTAIKLNPKYTDYWNTKIVFMDEKTSASYAELKAVYSEALGKVEARTKVNLVTSFAVITEKNGQTGDAISLWEYAKNLYPTNSSVYQAEIDRLKAI